MDILDYFDIYNVGHLAAYRILSETGSWPRDFIPKEVKFSTGWQIMIVSKMATAWIDYLDFDIESRTPLFLRGRK